MSGNHVFIYLKAEPSAGALEVLQRTFTLYKPSELHYVRMAGSIEEYAAHRAAFDKEKRVVYFFLVYEGQITSLDETCWRVVFDPQFTPERIQIVSTESGLSRIATAGVLENRTSEELLDQALEYPDEILR